MIYSSRFMAVLDACVLYPAPLRDLLLTVAEGELYIPKWTYIIHDEWTRNLLKNRPDIKKENLESTVSAMRTAFPDADVIGFESIIDILDLPDEDDRHVLAAAIRCNADVIVTDNIKDFPQEILDQYDIEAQTPDTFIYNLIELDPKEVKAAILRQSSRLKNPPQSPLEVIDHLERNGLTNSTKLLRSFFQ